MMRITTIVGARPQIIKAAAISRVVMQQFSGCITEQIIHTGQHYDRQLSQVFFEELQVPSPRVNLGVGSHDHGKQTALMISRIEEQLKKDPSDAVLVYGDTNSTLAGALAAVKLHIPVIHVEAGMRSFNKTMPEEINRVLCDHVSTLLFTPTTTGLNNLLREGFTQTQPHPFHINRPGIYHSGDIMYDNSLFFRSLAEQKSTILRDHSLTHNSFLLVTLHRANNTDDPKRLTDIFHTISAISRQWQIPAVVPLHPRTARLLKKNLPSKTFAEIRTNPHLLLLPPVSYLDMVLLEKDALLVMTDSGGVQKEAYFNRKPCIILRDETEWTEIVENKAAVLTDANPERIMNAFYHFQTSPPQDFPPVFGDGHAAAFICHQICHDLG